MTTSHWWLIALGVLSALGIVLLVSPWLQFLTGGMLVNLGYRMQDHLHALDLEHADATPQQVWEAVHRHNELAANVRARFPRTTEKPAVAMVVCMDARLDTEELVGDTRHHYFVIRTAGSVLGPAEQEMLELAVHKGVKLILLTTHTDCAAEHIASDRALSQAFPTLTKLVHERDRGIAEFIARPQIAQRIAEGKLLLKRLVLNTPDERLLPATLPHAAEH